MHDCVKFSIPISGCQCFDSHSERGQAFGVQRKQPDGQIQAGDEVEYFEEDPSLDRRLNTVTEGIFYVKVFSYVRNLLLNLTTTLTIKC